MKLIHLPSQQQIANTVIEAKTFYSRARGLLGRSSWPVDQALWIHDCNSIHTFFMRFPIDVIFVCKDLKVVRVQQNVRAYRLLLPVWKADSVFEFFAGNPLISNLKPGDPLHVGA